MSRPSGERGAPLGAAAHEARRAIHRRRFGWIGTEPPEGRNPVRRYGSLATGIVAVMVCATGATQAAAALALICLGLGAPRAWTWAHDRLSSASWVVGAALLVVGETIYITGDAAARQAFGSGHRSVGVAAALISLSPLVALLGYMRRWGTSGNIFFTSRQLRRGDPEASAAVRRRAEREGIVPRDHDE